MCKAMAFMLVYKMSLNSMELGVVLVAFNARYRNKRLNL